MKPGERHRLGIGLVGLGSISQVHLAGYEKFGLPVVAAYDVSSRARKQFTSTHPAVRVYDSLDDLIADPRVEVIDLATPHHRDSRVPVIQRITAARKPVFIQKPMAMGYADAQDLVTILEASGVPGMVNQNMCFTPGCLAIAPVLVEQKAIGEPFLAHVDFRTRFDCEGHRWFGKDERWWTVGCTVHHLAVLQMIFGPPEIVYGITGKDPAQPGVLHDGYGHLILSYPSGLQVTVFSTGTYYGRNPKEWAASEFWAQGPLGVIDWRVEAGYTLSLRKEIENPEESNRHLHVPTPGQWFPDAFGLGMDHFQQALAAGAEPRCSAQDNLYVVAVMEALYESSRNRRSVRLSEVMGHRYRGDYGPGWLHGYREWKPESLASER